MKKQVSFALVLLITITAIFSTTDVQASAKKHSVYSYASSLSSVYPSASIKKDSHGYYFTYRNNGYFECYLGTSSTMYFKNFAKCLGGSTNTVVKKTTITKTEYELKKLSSGLLAAYLFKNVNWLIGWCLGVGADTAMGKLLRTPGTYKFTTNVSTIRIRDGAISGSPYTFTYYVYGYDKVGKYNSNTKKWEKLTEHTDPQYFW